MNLFKYRSEDSRTIWAWQEHADAGVLDTTLDSLLAAPDFAQAVQEAKTSRTLPRSLQPLAPVDSSEIWAAGVTYERSRDARREESEGGGDFYDKVYTADRPELFLKAPGWRAVGDTGEVAVRSDSRWDVPEPELTLVVNAQGQIVGATVGNDMSSRSIEGENPLYLPQAKVYDGSCAIGPRIRLLDNGIALDQLGIGLRIERDGNTAFAGTTSTSRMRRRPDELAGWLFREISFPTGAFLMTGTGLVPPDDFTLRSGDAIAIEIEEIGILRNSVR